jgi:ABC-type glycerol-3-phosphate transport system substrate-binding protein
MTSKKLNRRDFLRMGALGVAGAALAGCCPTPEPETIVITQEVAGERVEVEVTKEVVKEVEKEVIKEVGAKEVRFLTETWNWEKLNMANATDHYNQELRVAEAGYQMVVDPAPDGWDTKVAQMVKDGELLWNGHLRATNLGDVPRRNRLGILQPWDEYINASTVPWAGQFWDEVLPNILESFQIDGKLYAFPWDGELYCRVYNKMIWDTIGETPAETLDEFERQLEEILAANPDKTPLCLRHHNGHPDQHMLMQLWTDNPWIEVEGAGILDVKGEAYANVLTMLKRWYDKGIITDDSWGQTMYDSWNTGNTACGQSGAAWLQSTAQKVFGIANFVPTTNFVINAGDTPKTTTFANGAMLFKDAEYPQECADWLLWMVDPTVEKVANYSFIRGHLNYYHIPMYQSIYDNILPTDDSWAWMAGILDMVKASASYPANAMTNEIVPIINVWEEKFVHGEVTLDEAVNGMYDEFMDAVKAALEA